MSELQSSPAVKINDFGVYEEDDNPVIKLRAERGSYDHVQINILEVRKGFYISSSRLINKNYGWGIPLSNYSTVWLSIEDAFNQQVTQIHRDPFLPKNEISYFVNKLILEFNQHQPNLVLFG